LNLPEEVDIPPLNKPAKVIWKFPFITSNQYIFTTHSPTVLNMFYDFEIINLGQLE